MQLPCQVPPLVFFGLDHQRRVVRSPTSLAVLVGDVLEDHLCGSSVGITRQRHHASPVDPAVGQAQHLPGILPGEEASREDVTVSAADHVPAKDRPSCGIGVIYHALGVENQDGHWGGVMQLAVAGLGHLGPLTRQPLGLHASANDEGHDVEGGEFHIVGPQVEAARARQIEVDFDAHQQRHERRCGQRPAQSEVECSVEQREEKQRFDRQMRHDGGRRHAETAVIEFVQHKHQRDERLDYPEAVVAYGQPGCAPPHFIAAHWGRPLPGAC